MPRYRVARPYAARLNGHTDVRWPGGNEEELSAEDAAWAVRDGAQLEEVKPKPARKTPSRSRRSGTRPEPEPADNGESDDDADEDEEAS